MTITVIMTMSISMSMSTSIRFSNYILSLLTITIDNYTKSNYFS